MAERSNWAGRPKRDDGSKGAAKLPASLPEPVSLKWDFAYIPLILLTVGLTAVLYAQMPDQIPNHADFAGNVNGYMTKSPLAVMWPVITQLVLAAIMVVAHVAVNKIPTRLKKGAPHVVCLAAALFVRAWGGFTVTVGLLLAVLFALFPSQFAGLVGLDFLGIAGEALALGACIAAGVLTARYGTDGMKAVCRRYGEAAVREVGQDGGEASDKRGAVFWNPDDPRVFIPSGFGMSWNLNLARPASWAIIAGIALLTIGIVVACVLLS